MEPIVNLIKLGRMPYVKALNVQRLLFDDLKNTLTATSTTSTSNNYLSGVKNEHSVEPKILSKDGDLTYNNSKNRFSFKTNKINISNSHRNSLILVEHEPVYTIGIRTKDYDDNYLVKLKKQLNEHNLSADFVKTNRGGLITFHGPGQLVAYPIIYLGDFSRTIKNKSVRTYVNTLEATIIDTLNRVGIPDAHTVRENPGVWLGGGERKIAFIGIACKRFVTMHGISINCDCDLSWFNHIVSCGIEDKMITSVHQELQAANQSLKPPSNKEYLPEVNQKHSIAACFSEPTRLSPSMKIEDGLVDDLNGHPCRYPASSVDYVADAFCQSFSQHFDCCMIETDDHSLHNESQ